MTEQVEISVFNDKSYVRVKDYKKKYLILWLIVVVMIGNVHIKRRNK